MSDDLYARLGVSRDADEKEIKKAYLKLVKNHHPDKGGDEEEFKRIQEANEVLTDPERRRMYDMTGSVNPEEQGMPGGFPFDMGGLGGLFGGMFGGGGGMPFGMGGGMPGGRHRQKRPKGATKVCELPLGIADFYHGKQIQVTFHRQKFCSECKGEGSTQTTTCTDCGGRGMVSRMGMIGPGMMVQMNGPCEACKGEGKKALGSCAKCSGKKFQTQEKTLNVIIEPGMKPKDILVFPNECSDDPDCEQPGDVHYLLLDADEDIEWKRDGSALKATLSISLKESLLGVTKTIANHPGFPQGFEVVVPAGTQNQEVLRIAGGGMPIRSKSEKGDALVTVQVVLTPREKEILEKNKIILQGLFHD